MQTGADNIVEKGVLVALILTKSAVSRAAGKFLMAVVVFGSYSYLCNEKYTITNSVLNSSSFP